MMNLSKQFGSARAPVEQSEKSYTSSSSLGGAAPSRAQEAAPWWRLDVMLPSDNRYINWWMFTVFCSFLTAILVPFHIAFSATPGLGPGTNMFFLVMEVLLDSIFLLDVLLHLTSVATFAEDGLVVTQRRDIAKAYSRRMLVPDLLFAIPWDQFVLLAAGLESSDSKKALLLSLLGFIKLGRLYRLVHWFAYLGHNMLLSQLVLMMLRNQTYLFLLLHIAACLLYFIARVSDFAVDDSWVGRAKHRFEDQPTWVRYAYSYYYSISTYTGLGDSDFGTSSVAESVFMILYMSLNVVVAAYILGTVSMLMVLADKRSKVYRDRMSNLQQFVESNSVPAVLAHSMKEHLELHHNSEHAGEARVLSMYPIAITRRVKRHLYLATVKNCYLFRGCRAKFLDAVLSVAHVDVFLPHVQVLACGDIVNELMLVVEGQLATTQPKRAVAAQPDPEGSLHSEDGSLHAAHKVERGGKSYGNAEALALMAITKSMMATPGSPTGSQMGLGSPLPSGGGGGHRTSSTGDMTAGKAALMRFARASLTSHLDLAERESAGGRRSAGGARARNAVVPVSPTAAQITAHNSKDDTSAGKRKAGIFPDVPSPTPGGAGGTIKTAGSGEVDALGAVSQFLLAHGQSGDLLQRLSESGASGGPWPETPSRRRLMAAGGVAPMSPAGPSAADLVRQENPLSMTSVHGKAAFAQAASNGTLTTMEPGDCLGELAFFAEVPSYDGMWTSCVTRLLVIDKDKYEQLAAAHPQQTRHLLENLKQRMEQNVQLTWASALDTVPDMSPETLSELADFIFGDRPMVDMPVAVRGRVLASMSKAQRDKIRTAEGQAATARQLCLRVEQMRIYNFLAAAAQSNQDQIKTMISQGISPDACDYDRRTGLMLACHEGSEAVARLLLESGADAMAKDNFGNTAMYEAVKMGHDNLIDLLLKYKASLGIDGLMMAAQMCTCVFEGDLVRLKRILRSGCDVDAADYDKRCALHIAACEGNLTAVKVLVEEGGATVDFQDRWGATPLSEARRVGAQPVVEFLEPIMELAAQGRVKCMLYPDAPTWKAYKQAQEAAAAKGAKLA